MKTLKALLVLAFVGLAGTASAQFANSGSSASGSSIWTTVNTDGYNRVYVSYNPIFCRLFERHWFDPETAIIFGSRCWAALWQI